MGMPVHVEPPVITRPGRKSPYIDMETLSQVAKMVCEGWTSPIDPLDTPGKARIAANAYKRELSSILDKPVDAFAGRIWEEVDEKGKSTGKHRFAIVLKEGA